MGVRILDLTPQVGQLWIKFRVFADFLKCDCLSVTFKKGRLGNVNEQNIGNSATYFQIRLCELHLKYLHVGSHLFELNLLKK